MGLEELPAFLDRLGEHQREPSRVYHAMFPEEGVALSNIPKNAGRIGRNLEDHGYILGRGVDIARSVVFENDSIPAPKS